MPLSQCPYVPGSTETHTGMIEFSRYDHVLLTYAPGGEDSLRAFYGGVLGLTEVAGKYPGDAIWYEVAGTELHFAAEEPSALSRRHIAFEITNLEQTRQHLEEKGLEIAYSTKIEGRERFFIRDPFGNRLEFLAYG